MFGYTKRIFILFTFTAGMLSFPLRLFAQEPQVTPYPGPSAELIQTAEVGNPASECKLGLIYLYGKGEPQNYEQATKWFQPSSAQGNGEASYCNG